jgi:DNA polymerase I-like protein with 3'-5' exonuclease and polymerase domains
METRNQVILENAARVLNSTKEVVTKIACDVLNKTPEKLSDSDYTFIKDLTFPFLYGSDSATLTKCVGLTEDEAKRLLFVLNKQLNK